MKADLDRAGIMASFGWPLDARKERSCLFHRDHRLSTNNVHELSVALANMHCHNVTSQDDSLWTSGRLVLQGLKTVPTKIRFGFFCWSSALLRVECSQSSSAIYAIVSNNLPEAKSCPQPQGLGWGSRHGVQTQERFVLHSHFHCHDTDARRFG